MIAFITRRLLLGCVTIWLISVLSFVIIQLPPGDFVDAYMAQLAASGSAVSAEEAAGMRKLYGLDQPGYVQYGKWIGRIVSGDFGVSMEWRRPVTEVIGDRLWLTLALSFAALILTWVLALPIGIYSRGAAIFHCRLRLHAGRLHRHRRPELPARPVIMYFAFTLFGVECRRAVFVRVRRRRPGAWRSSGT